jgi:Ca-activated chloride channel family protein
VRLHGADREVVEEIRQLGLRYGIITEYTSYLVEEPLLTMTRDQDFALDRAMELAAAPAEATGAEAFKRADASSRLRQADALEEAEAIVAGVMTPEGGRGHGAAAVRHIGRKLFVLTDGTWTDVTFDDSLQVIELAPYSEAYFELARRLPAIREYLALGDKLIIAGDGVVLKLVADGATEWDSQSLRTVLDGFAGSL